MSNLSVQLDDASERLKALISEIKISNKGETFVTKRLEHYLKTVNITSISYIGDGKNRYDSSGMSVIPTNDEVYYKYKLEYTDGSVNGMFLFN